MRGAIVVVGALMLAAAACGSGHGVTGFTTSDLPTGLVAPPLTCADISAAVGVTTHALHPTHPVPGSTLSGCGWTGTPRSGHVFVIHASATIDPASLFVNDCGGDSPLTPASLHRAKVPVIAGLRGAACLGDIAASPGSMLMIYEGNVEVYVEVRDPAPDPAAEVTVAEHLHL